jgi:hypothetical protein
MSERDRAPESEPSNWDELFPGRFLKAGHLSQPTEILIERVFTTEIDDKPAQVARFAPLRGITQREWGLNKTNGLVLKALFGEAVKRDWTGKRVVIKSSVVEHGREKGKPCIRVCGSPDITADIKVVIDFHTKRIKPFVIHVRATGAIQAPAAKPAASQEATRLAAAYREATTLEQLNDLAIDVEEALAKEAISNDEAAKLMAGITKKEAALKEPTDVIT